MWRARDERLGRTVAIKLLHDADLDEPRALRRVLKEARHAGSLDHPAIVHVYDAGVDEGGAAFVAMSFIDGQPLDRIALPLELRDAVEIGAQVADALAAAHRKRIVHRDIKPGNIMVCSDECALRAHVLDFGLSLIPKIRRKLIVASVRRP